MNTEKLAEVKQAMIALGYSNDKKVVVKKIDKDRCQVFYNWHLIGIYDFRKHTFVD